MDTVSDRNIAMLFSAVLIITAAVAVPGPARAQSGGHGDGHAEMHHAYKEWIDNRGFGCCDDQDCRPVRADPGPLGWRVWIDGRWVAVPPDTVLGITSPDGRSHVCMSPDAQEPRCFVPGEPRS
jgi:hypothetical protein